MGFNTTHVTLVDDSALIKVLNRFNNMKKEDSKRTTPGGAA